MEKTNFVSVKGTLTKKFEYSHIFYGKRYYKGIIEVERSRSKERDCIPIIAEESKIKKLHGKQKLQVTGELRKYSSKYEETKPFVYLHAQNITIIPREAKLLYSNMVQLKGRVCSKPFYKITYSGKHLANFQLEVERPGIGNTKDYIPCILWGRMARYAKICVEEGDEITIENGWIQTRKYKKRVGEKLVTKEVLEVIIERFY